MFQRTIFLFSALFTFGWLAAQPAAEAITEKKYNPEVTTIFYKLGDRTLPIKVMQYGEATGIVCINLHDNENTSVLAAQSVLESKGGTLIKIENNRERVIRFRLHNQYYSFDPNRIFSRTGIEQTLNDNHRISPAAIDEVEKFAARILELIPEETGCVIALHNNTDGAFSVKSYLPGNDRATDAREVFAGKQQDEDDIILTTDNSIYQKMAESGYNSIWQDNENAKKDGSLSVYYGEKNKRYINIETQHGRLEQYREMLERLYEILSL
jgi:hypothetical protein